MRPDESYRAAARRLCRVPEVAVAEGVHRLWDLEMPAAMRLGFIISDLTVTHVFPRSICAGFVRPGDRITSLNGVDMMDQNAFMDAYDSSEGFTVIQFLSPCPAGPPDFLPGLSVPLGYDMDFLVRIDEAFQADAAATRVRVCLSPDASVPLGAAILVPTWGDGTRASMRAVPDVLETPTEDGRPGPPGDAHASPGQRARVEEDGAHAVDGAGVCDPPGLARPSEQDDVHRPSTPSHSEDELVLVGNLARNAIRSSESDESPVAQDDPALAVPTQQVANVDLLRQCAAIVDRRHLRITGRLAERAGLSLFQRCEAATDSRRLRF